MKIDRLAINCDDDDGDLIDMACNGVDCRTRLAYGSGFVGNRMVG